MMTDGKLGGKHTVSTFRRNQLLEMARISRIRWIVSELSQSSSPVEKKIVDGETKEKENEKDEYQEEEIDRDIPGLDCLQDIFNFLVDVSREDRPEEVEETARGVKGNRKDDKNNTGDPEEDDGLDILSLVPSEEELLYANEMEESATDKDSIEEDPIFIEVHRYEDVECDDTCYKMFLDKLRRIKVIDVVRSIRRYV